jgi:hypothetical protein
VDVPPSPNVQNHDVGELADVSVNATVRGAVPDVGVPVKLAIGVVGAVTEKRFVREPVRPSVLMYCAE